MRESLRSWRPAYPPHRLDIRAADLVVALEACARPGDPTAAARAVESALPRRRPVVVCLSVRSGLDLLLTALDLPEDSEVLVSAVTVPAVPAVVEGHGLRPVPVDLDPETLSPPLERLEAALTPQTRAVIVAHLFGNRIDLAPVAEFAQRHGLLLVEDAAQSFLGPGDTGWEAGDVTMFSFGPIKTATALGGAVLHVRDEKLAERMRSLQEAWPVQDVGAYRARVLRFLGLLSLQNPLAYGSVVAACSTAGRDPDVLLRGLVRGFAPSSTPLLEVIRRRPCAPLAQLLVRRLATFDEARLHLRTEWGERVIRALPSPLAYPGGRVPVRTHWVVPVVAPRPGRLLGSLGRRGLSGTGPGAVMGTVAAPAGRPQLAPVDAVRMLSRTVFVPAYPELGEKGFSRLVLALEEAAAGAAADDGDDSPIRPQL